VKNIIRLINLTNIKKDSLIP